MERFYYSDTVSDFLRKKSDEILGNLARNSGFAIETTQRDAWLAQIQVLQLALSDQAHTGKVYFEFAVPRLGKRIDTVLVQDGIVFVIEFKVGESEFKASASEQVWDYAIDLQNFHQTSHNLLIAPILVITGRANHPVGPIQESKGALLPVRCTAESLSVTIAAIVSKYRNSDIDPVYWESGRYSPTPTIIEAAMALYSGHSVTDISRSDASAVNLSQTSGMIDKIIQDSRTQSRKSICFVTGVPGAGKTLVGLDVATKYVDSESALHSVFLSGNDPLVAILREALARDKVHREKEAGRKCTKTSALSEVKAFIQNVHHFRDECLIEPLAEPPEHVAIFDEAQRAWNLEKTASFMRQKKNTPNFTQSEPSFLISCLNRHRDWAVIVCLVGGGQEINTGEAGISEWIESMLQSFPDWHIYLSPRLTDSEYGAGSVYQQLQSHTHVLKCDELHLSVSMRSFRAENVSLLMKQILDLEEADARETLQQIGDRYPIVVTRDLRAAKRWVRSQARGSERYGLVASSGAQRLKPYAIDVKSPMKPVHWFLNGKRDVRSSYYLEAVATEFDIQGLELDWACVTWDADFRLSSSAWEHWSFVGDRWNRIRKLEKQKYLKNAYRVLLTRARQGMVIFVPRGKKADHTRKCEFYDETFAYLTRVGFKEFV